MLASYLPGLVLALASTASCELQLLHQLSLATGLKYARPLDGFLSYSLEFFSFPDFAGRLGSVPVVVRHGLKRDFRQQ